MVGLVCVLVKLSTGQAQDSLEEAQPSESLKDHGTDLVKTSHCRLILKHTLQVVDFVVY
ncbi:hypothetical protein J6590_047442 [Homalodisca vitripennis]|nr:hypothetical protein J6590_047442 [Homalodisca vitripennis]